MNNLVSYDPFVDTGMDELFRGFFKPVRMEGARTPVTIKMDVTETDDGYMVHAEIPGAKKEDINVEIEGNQVTVKFNGVVSVHMQNDKFAAGPFALQFGACVGGAPGGPIKQVFLVPAAGGNRPPGVRKGTTSRAASGSRTRSSRWAGCSPTTAG